MQTLLSHHPETSRHRRALASICSVVLVVVLAVWATPAMASGDGVATAAGEVASATAAAAPVVKTATEAAKCAGQSFSTPFAEYGDENLYTLVPGGNFEGETAQHWTLINGAHIAQATRPDGSTGSILDLPAGSVAISPPVCVTLAYPTARVWASTPEEGEGVSVGVAYIGTKTEIKGKLVAQLHGSEGSWGLPPAFGIHPALGGKEESAREMRFVLVSGKNTGSAELYGLYVDPRMV